MINLSEINKINPFVKVTGNMPKPQNKASEEDKKETVDLSKLPDGVSTFNIDGDEITIWKKGDDIKTQVVGSEVADMNEIRKKVAKELEKQQ